MERPIVKSCRLSLKSDPTNACEVMSGPIEPEIRQQETAVFASKRMHCRIRPIFAGRLASPSVREPEMVR